MPYLYTPPQRTEIYRNFGNARGLATKHYVSTTTYRLSGQWFNTIEPPNETLAAADYVFLTPTVVPDSLFAELSAFGIGTLTPV